jgi:hypothetical protein
MSTERALDALIEEVFVAHGRCPKMSLPNKEATRNDIARNTRTIAVGLLEEILERGDSMRYHRPLDYDSFLLLQLELLRQILYSERRIQNLRRDHPTSRLVKLLGLRRNMLRLLGSTLAWILLEFDVPFVRLVSKGFDSGYLVGKEGTFGEVSAMIRFHSPPERTAILHGITHCLRVGDITIVSGAEHAPIEVKSGPSANRRLDKRGRRQLAKLQVLKEYRQEGKSTRLFRGRTLIRRQLHQRDAFNWKTLSEVGELALTHGYAIQFPEVGVAYAAYRDLNQTDRFVADITKKWKEPMLLGGTLDHHILGLPEILPFTLFEISLEVKKSILLGEITVATLVDLNVICRKLEKTGMRAWIKDGLLNVEKTGAELAVGWHLMDRLRYECLSTTTALRYIQHTLASETGPAAAALRERG